MKKDALFYGVVLTFIAFVLMIVSLVFEAWRSGRSSKLAQSIQTQKTPFKGEVRDFSDLKIVTEADGTPMVFVPEGPFPMGSPPVEGDPDEMPQRTIYLSSYYIDLDEVPSVKYNSFVNATRRQPPVVPVFSDDLSLITR